MSPADEKIIIRPVNISILREDFPIKDEPGFHNPRGSRIYEARFDWTPATSSERWRFLRGYGPTEEDATCDLIQSRDIEQARQIQEDDRIA